MFIEADDCIRWHETRFGVFGAFGGGIGVAQSAGR